MRNMRFYRNNAFYLATLLGLIVTVSNVQAEERLPASVALSETTKEFLADPGRTGSLLGSILAGAAVANPLAPLVGSVAGFMIGKSSAFSNKDSAAGRRVAYNNRSLSPQNGFEVTGLAGLTGKTSQAPEPQLLAALPESTEIETPTDPTTSIVIVGPDNKSGTQMGMSQSMSQSKSMLDQSVPTATVPTSGHSNSMTTVQKLLSQACSNRQLAQSISSNCYYFSQ